MECSVLYFLWCGVLFLLNIEESYQSSWVITDKLEDNINPEDLQMLLHMKVNTSSTEETKNGVEHLWVGFVNPVGSNLTTTVEVDCFGLENRFSRMLRSQFNMMPDSSDSVNTQFYFFSRNINKRVQVMPGSQFTLEWVDFKPNRTTVLIVHGFMSHSKASWVNDMAKAFLVWGDVNVIVVDWSGGGKTWKYWKAVANTRTVASDIVDFMRQLIEAGGARIQDMHFVGHSLGAHIVSCASYQLGIVGRITGLDPAEPCFKAMDGTERLDASDADYVDVIHTNGRLTSTIGFGLPGRAGDADFYPNGGMKQPGCVKESSYKESFSTRMKQAICSHGRAYLLLTESLINNNCRFRARKWDLTYEGLNASVKAACDKVDSCSEMGIRAIGMDKVPRAKGSYFVFTTDKEPYCPTEWERLHLQPNLLSDFQEGYSFEMLFHPNSAVYACPMGKSLLAALTITTKAWFQRRFG